MHKGAIGNTDLAGDPRHGIIQHRSKQRKVYRDASRLPILRYRSQTIMT